MVLSMTESDLLGCCGSREWARRMMAGQPFDSSAQMLDAADSIWGDLGPVDWLDAFAAHPRSVRRVTIDARLENSPVLRARGPDTLARLATEIVLTKRSSGTFTSCARAARVAWEMLSILESRLRNDHDTELRVAGGAAAANHATCGWRNFCERDHYTRSRHCAGAVRRAGVPVRLEQPSSGGTWIQLGSGITNSDGRLGSLLADDAALTVGIYRLIFDTRAYAPEGLYPEVSITFEVREKGQHYHIPLLLSPYGYTTYRGS